jgi:arabinose-5-phosphate isomerase
MERGPGILELTAAEAMTRGPVAIPATTLAAEALNIMESRKITSIVVVDGTNRVTGVVHLHDLWRTEMF